MLALAVLVVVGCVRVSYESALMSLPKATSDGPIYENLAYHLSIGRGFWIDLQDPQWRALYEKSAADYSVYLGAPPQSMAMTGRPPLFPLAVAAIYGVVGRGPIAFAIVRFFSAVCIAVACSVAVANAASILSRVDRSGRKFANWSVACGCAAAVLLAASNRTLHSYAGDFLTEPLALLLTQLLVAVLLAATHRFQSDDSGRTRGLIVSVAVLMSAMILARSLFVVWIPGICLLLIAIVRSPNRWRVASAALSLTLVCMSPWWIRNCVVLDRFMPLGTQGSTTMLGGYCDEALAAGGDWQHAPEQRLRLEMSNDPAFQSLSSEVERELMIADEAKRRVRTWIRSHIDDLPRLFVARVVTHWNPYTGKSLVWRLLMLAGAIYLLVRRRPEAWVLVGLPVMNTVLVASMYTTGGRFLVPLYGILFTLSAIGTAVLVELLFGIFSWAKNAMRSRRASAA